MRRCVQRGSPGHQTPLPGNSHSAANKVKKEEKVSDHTQCGLSESGNPNFKGHQPPLSPVHQLRQAPIFPRALPTYGICSFTHGSPHAAQDSSTSTHRSPPLWIAPLCPSVAATSPLPPPQVTCSLSERMATSTSSGSTQLMKPTSPAVLSLMLSQRGAGTQGKGEVR